MKDTLQINAIGSGYGKVQALRDLDSAHRRRRDRGCHRSQRRREEHVAEDDLGAGAGDQRRNLVSWTERERPDGA